MWNKIFDETSWRKCQLTEMMKEFKIASSNGELLFSNWGGDRERLSKDPKTGKQVSVCLGKSGPQPQVDDKEKKIHSLIPIQNIWNILVLYSQVWIYFCSKD
jgi:topoisomerase IA-like protein